MTDKLPPNLLALFAPRPPLRWVEPTDHPPEKRFTRAVTGVAECLGELQKYKETDQYTPTESWLEARDRKKEEKKTAIKQLLEQGPKKFNPSDDPNIRGNALSTMIVSRLSYDADERDLERHFGRFGSIERIRVISDTRAHEKPNKKKKPHRGYAFIVFEREPDMQAAVKSCDGDRIRGRAIKTDVERGRTVHGWKPRRLGGGLGGRGYTKIMPSRPVGPRGFGDGFRGGFRGFDGGRPRGGGRGGRGGGFRGDFGGFDRRNGDRSFSGPNLDSRGPGRFDDRHGGYRGDRGDGGRFGDRDSGRRTGSNMEPIGRRDGGERDRGRDRRDYDRPRDDDNRKRAYEGGGHDDSRKMPRY
ncbi:RNA recognition motif domain-containing protein [Hirsutella rhossiliensis]|uniref:U1 small nuclear ribonucleoprotein 70 kDa n=1 Tax=Hirsutella rhossiliensis TaxID=111463 RepID=A0A9P8SM82_9HYPO|nr:RNA recognition motif domain-containing protein [Hirsutella rhossiliensis]KAH0965901.1 RNA recognition motif domain-containing protein [Hirsutella rhossiliensis]